VTGDFDVAVEIRVRATLATARVYPAKQCRDYRKDDQDGWHRKRKNNYQDRSADFEPILKADKAKEPAQQKIASDLQRDDQVEFDGAGR
jgi:hypothetical protein